jgi:hypothetical protein
VSTVGGTELLHRDAAFVPDAHHRRTQSFVTVEASDRLTISKLDGSAS